MAHSGAEAVEIGGFEGEGPEGVVDWGKLHARNFAGLRHGRGSLLKSLYHHGVAEGRHSGTQDSAYEGEVLGRTAYIHYTELDVVGYLYKGLTGYVGASAGERLYMVDQRRIIGVCLGREGLGPVAKAVRHAEVTGTSICLEVFGKE